jgi:hypothetical protein
MATPEQRDIRTPRPEDAATDPQNAARQEQIHRDGEAARREAARVRATTPAEVRDHTVGEIVENEERRSRE